MSDTHCIDVNGKEVEVKMSYGMLNALCNVAGDADAAVMFNLDNDLRQAALKQLLSKRDKKGNITTEFSEFTDEVVAEKAIELLDWAGGHVLDFFLTAAGRAKNLGESREEQMKALQPT